MNGLERRTLLGAAGIGAIAALSKAGPLNPPAGPVAPTGRTLDEVYNKIPAVGGGDGRTPISAPGTISTAGSYVLTGNLTSAGTPLTISADDVTVDLNGFTIASTSVTLPVVSISGARTNVTVRNGQIAGGLTGITTTGALTRLKLEDLRIATAKVTGVNLLGGTARSCIFRRCEVVDTGITTTAADSNGSIHGMLITGHNHRIEECTIARLFWNGQGSVLFRGISLFTGGQTGSLVSRCHFTNETAITGSGLHFNSGASVYRDNSAVNFSAQYTIGAGNVNGGGNV